MRRGLIGIGSLTVAAVLASIAGAAAAVAGPVDDPTAVNLPPQVILTAPTEGSGGVLGCPVTFTAVAADPDSGIARVEFYLNGYLLATDSTAPYEVTVAHGPFVPASTGETNTAFAVAFDDGQPPLSGRSQTVSFFMVDPPPGLPGEPAPCLQATPPGT